MKQIFSTLLLGSLTLTGCTDAYRANFSALGSRAQVEVISGGQVVRTYVSSGKVSSELHTDGWYFMDAATGKLVKVSGQVIITELGETSATIDLNGKP